MTSGSYMKSGLVSHKVVHFSLLMILEALWRIALSLLNFEFVIFKLILQIDILSISCEIAIRWIPQGLTAD